MNKISLIEVEYIRPSRSIEVLLISKEGLSKLFFLYNYEGFHFRLFSKISEMIKFFKNEHSDFIEFEEETEIDSFLKNIELNF
jgi:hypothetical protein